MAQLHYSKISDIYSWTYLVLRLKGRGTNYVQIHLQEISD